MRQVNWCKLEVGSNALQVPCQGRVLCALAKDGDLRLYMEVDADPSTTVTRYFRVVGTGYPFKVDEGVLLEYINSVIIDDIFVWHVYEEVEGDNKNETL